MNHACIFSIWASPLSLLLPWWCGWRWRLWPPQGCRWLSTTRSDAGDGSSPWRTMNIDEAKTCKTGNGETESFRLPPSVYMRNISASIPSLLLSFGLWRNVFGRVLWRNFGRLLHLGHGLGGCETTSRRNSTKIEERTTPEAWIWSKTIKNRWHSELQTFGAVTLATSWPSLVERWWKMRARKSIWFNLGKHICKNASPIKVWSGRVMTCLVVFLALLKCLPSVSASTPWFESCI